jgi:hypothetical protein
MLAEKMLRWIFDKKRSAIMSRFDDCAENYIGEE